MRFPFCIGLKYPGACRVSPICGRILIGLFGIEFYCKLCIRKRCRSLWLCFLCFLVQFLKEQIHWIALWDFRHIYRRGCFGFDSDVMGFGVQDESFGSFGFFYRVITFLQFSGFCIAVFICCQCLYQFVSFVDAIFGTL